MSDNECFKLTGRLRDICRGFDDVGNLVDPPPPNDRASYIRLWIAQGLLTPEAESLLRGSEGDPLQDTPGPTLLRQAVNFGVAQVRHMLDGRRKVSDVIYASRLAVCSNCASKDPERLQCREKTCGCDLTIKCRWASEACPLGKWSRHEEPL